MVCALFSCRHGTSRWPVSAHLPFICSAKLAGAGAEAEVHLQQRGRFPRNPLEQPFHHQLKLHHQHHQHHQHRWLGCRPGGARIRWATRWRWEWATSSSGKMRVRCKRSPTLLPSWRRKGCTVKLGVRARQLCAPLRTQCLHQGPPYVPSRRTYIWRMWRPALLLASKSQQQVR